MKENHEITSKVLKVTNFVLPDILHDALTWTKYFQTLFPDDVSGNIAAAPVIASLPVPVKGPAFR